MSIDYKIIGKRIKERRKICQITQETLAEKLEFPSVISVK